MDALLLTIYYFVAALVVVIVGVWLFELVTTKYKDWDEIASGNRAVALSVGGKLVGLSIILLFSILENDSVLAMLLWGVFGIIMQLLVYYVFEWLTPRFSVQDKLKEGNIAVGIMSMCVSLGVAFIVGASIT